MKVRLLRVKYPDNPRLSLATDEAIFRLVTEEKSPPTLWLWRHRNAIILGRFQLAEEEVNMDVARMYGMIIAKRFTVEVLSIRIMEQVYLASSC